MGTETYVIRGGVEGRERLRLLSEIMGPSTRALLADVGIRAGSVCLDVGCGGGDVAFELARAAGPTGRAVGVDLDDTDIEIARREGTQQALANIAFETRNVTEFEDIQMKLVHPAALEGGIKLLTCVTLESIAGAVLDDNLTTDEELRETIEELYAFARDPRAVLGGPRVFQAWGRS